MSARVAIVCVCLSDVNSIVGVVVMFFFFFQAEDGIRDLVRSRGLGDVYKRQSRHMLDASTCKRLYAEFFKALRQPETALPLDPWPCLLYTSDAADGRSSVDLGGRRIIKKKNQHKH